MNTVPVPGNTQTTAPIVIDTTNPIVQGNTSIIPVTFDSTNSAVIPYEQNTAAHIDEDYAFTRQNLYEIMKKAMKGLEELTNIATASQNIRAYEALAPLVKAVSEANEKLLILQNNRQALDEQEPPAPTPGQQHFHGNTVVFVGTTADALEQQRQLTRTP